MSELKPYLVDVPVRVNVWIREECQRKQFEVLKQARPSIMFLISDGGRNEKEWEAIKNNRAIFDNEIDWIQAETLFDIKTVKAKNEGREMKGVGRVLNGPKALNNILKGMI